MGKLDIRRVPKEYRESISLKGYGNIAITTQPTGYGEKRFFLCPMCGSRVQHIYLLDVGVRCRHCTPHRAYKPRTDVYQGGEAHIHYLMRKIARENKLELEFPFDYSGYWNKRPRYVRHKKWDKILRQMQTLENMRFSIILFKGTIDTKTIKYYLNQGIYDFTLLELKNAIIIWGYPARCLQKSESSIMTDSIRKRIR